jgi:hypothetical protein
MGLIVRLYAWFYLQIDYVKNSPGPLGFFSDANSGASAIVTSMFAFPIVALAEMILPIELSEPPYFWIVIVLIVSSGVMLMHVLRNAHTRREEFAQVKRWRERCSKDELRLLDVLSFIVSTLIMIGGMYLYWSVPG